MSEAKTKLGKRACPLCGESLHVRANAAGTVSIACQECDFSGFAKRGSQAAKLLTAGFNEPAPQPAPKPAEPKPRAPASAFTLGGLSA